MHDDFADWYRPCTAGTEVNLTGDLLTKRWAGIEKAAKEPGQGVLDMVRVALGRLDRASSFLSKFRAGFKEVDPAFQMSGNDLEVSVLAGSTLCWLFNQEGDVADAASLALLCATTVAKGPNWSEPFVSHAAVYLDKRLRGLRQPTEVRVPQFSAKKFKAAFDAFVTKFPENNLPQTVEPAKLLGEAITQSLSHLTEATAAAIRELDRQSDLRREETDVLWWMTAGISRDVGEPFKQLKTPAASIIAGKELADLVGPPGILPAKSILQSVIPPASGKAGGKAIPIHTAVNATTTEWREGLVKGDVVDRVADLCPLLAAVKFSLTTDEPDGWLSAYKKAYGVDPKAGLEPVELAHQTHRECLLAKLAAEK